MSRYARPGHNEITAALREIRAVLQACEEGEITIIAALDEIHDLSDLADTDTMMMALEDRAEGRAA